MEYVTILERLKSNYVVLKENFLCKSRPYVDGRPDALDELKSHYSSVINSPRTASYINNLEGLLRVLEKRNELSYDNIEPLIYIEARYVESPELGTLLRNYEGNMRDAPVVPLFNVYDALSEHSLESQPSIPNNVPSSGFVLQSPTTLPTLTPRSFHLTLSAPVQITAQRVPNHEDPQVARIVFLEVSDNLGRHWRDVARFLGVTEHDIDEIDCQPQLPLKEKALKALTKFQSKSDPSQWKSKLQQALEKARRRDVMEMAEELWSRKYQST